MGCGEFPVDVPFEVFWNLFRENSGYISTQGADRWNLDPGFLVGCAFLPPLCNYLIPAWSRCSLAPLRREHALGT
jgi:hypothetical protein